MIPTQVMFSLDFAFGMINNFGIDNAVSYNAAAGLSLTKLGRKCNA